MRWILFCLPCLIKRDISLFFPRALQPFPQTWKELGRNKLQKLEDALVKHKLNAALQPFPQTWRELPGEPLCVL